MKRRNFLATITFGLMYGKTLGKDIIKQLKETKFEDGKFTDQEIRAFDEGIKERFPPAHSGLQDYYVTWYFTDGKDEYGEMINCDKHTIYLAMEHAKKRLINIHNENGKRLKEVKFSLHNRRFEIEKIELKYPSIAYIKTRKFSELDEI